MNPYKKQVRPDRRDNLGVFSKPSRGPEYPAHLQRGEVRHPGGMKNEERLRIESRDKIATAYVGFRHSILYHSFEAGADVENSEPGERTPSAHR